MHYQNKRRETGRKLTEVISAFRKLTMSFVQKTDTFLFAGAFSEIAKGIQSFRYDTKSHRLTYIGTYGEYTSMSCMVTDGDLLVANVESAKDDLLVAFRIKADGSLEELNAFHSGSFMTAHLSIDRENHYIFASSMASASVSMIGYDSSGTLKLLDRCVFDDPGSFEIGYSTVERQSSSRIHFSTVMPDGKHLGVCNMGSDKVYILNIDAESHKLELCSELTVTTPGGEAPRYMVFSKDGKFCYMNTEVGNAVYVFAIGPDCSLTQCQVISTLDPKKDNPERGFSSVAIISKDGRYLFCGNRGQNNLVGFAIGENGLLTQTEFFDCYGEGPRGLFVGCNEEVVFVSNNASGTVSVIRYDKETGKLGECLQVVENVPGSANVVWSCRCEQ